MTRPLPARPRPWAPALLASLALLGCGAPTPVNTVSEPAEATVAPEPPACTAEALVTPRWYETGTGYEIFVRSFRDSDGDGVGDLAGLTASLDYLNDGDPQTTTDLGVDLLWLMPITESPSYHGYDVTDYGAVDSEYGDDDDLQALLAAANQRGIRVIVDLVMNHTSTQHPWFVDASTGEAATYRNFYVWADSDLGWQRPWGGGPTWHATPTGHYYGLFWGGMPDLNFTHEVVQATMTDVAMSWIDRGVDGFRLDAVRYLVETGGGDGQKDTEETLAYWRRLREASDDREDALLLGEAWANSEVVAKYFGTTDKPGLNMAFDFDTAGAIVDALVTGHGGALKAALCTRLDGWPAHGAAGTFATNHDMTRLASRLSVAGDDALRLVAAAVMTLPGTPWLYYGQELGLRNGPTSDDIDKRLPMQWADGPGVGFTAGAPWAAPRSELLADSVAGQTDDPESLLALYRRLIALRAATPALQRGSATVLDAEGTAGVPFVLHRTFEDQAVLVVLNVANEPSTITVTSGLPEQPTLVNLLGDEAVTVSGESGPLTLPELPAYGVYVLGSGEAP